MVPTLAALRRNSLLHLYDRHVRRLFDQTKQEVALRIELGVPRQSVTARRPLTARAAYPHKRVAIPIRIAARRAGIRPGPRQ
jgi:hypothetical protein